jgi:hypothetical protein
MVAPLDLLRVAGAGLRSPWRLRKRFRAKWLALNLLPKKSSHLGDDKGNRDLLDIKRLFTLVQEGAIGATEFSSARRCRLGRAATSPLLYIADFSR